MICIIHIENNQIKICFVNIGKYKIKIENNCLPKIQTKTYFLYITKYKIEITSNFLIAQK